MRLIKYISLFIVLLVIAIPYIVQFGSVYYLEKEFGVNASIEKIGINWFNGKLGIEGVHIYGENDRDLHLGQLAADIDIGLLFEEKLYIESLILTNFKTQIIETDEFWNIGGIKILKGENNEPENATATATEQKTAWQLGVGEIAVENVGIKIDSKDFNSHVVIKSFDFDKAVQWGPGDISSFQLALLVNESPANFKGVVRPFSKNIDLDLSVNVQSLSIHRLIQAIESSLPLRDAKATLNTEIQITYSRKTDKNEIAVNGQLELVGVAFSDLATDVVVKEEKILWNGSVSLSLPENINDGHIESLSTLSFSPLRVESGKIGLLLGGFNRLQLTNIRMNSFDSVVVDDISLQQFTAMEDVADRNVTPLTVGNIKISDMQYVDKSININQIDISKLQANLVVDGDGNLQLINKISGFSGDIDESSISKEEGAKAKKEKQEDSIEIPPGLINKETGEVAEKENKDKEEKQAEQSVIVKVGKINIAEDSYFHFTDKSVLPIFETKINKIKFLFNNLDTENKESWMLVDLSAGVDDYGRVGIKGRLQPFAKLINADMEAKFKNLALVPFSSYSGKYADLFIKRGSINSHIKINIVKDKLDVKNNIQLTKLKLEPGNSEASKTWMADMPMPLDMTLDVLRDKNDVISLDIPVEGLVSDPDFHLQDIYNTAMLKAAKFAATYYITQAVQPLGLIMTAGKLIGKATQPGFAPLLFDSGSPDISNINKSHLDKIAVLFKNRPKLNLTICGMSTESDWIVIKENMKQKESKLVMAEKEEKKIREQQLLKLATLRTQLVKRYIVDSQDIDPGRLQECNSKIDKDVNAKPGVLLTL